MIQIIPYAILGTAIIQWYGIGERTYHAWWMWYKFKDYGGGQTDMSCEMVTMTYALSVIFILTSIILKKRLMPRTLTTYVNSVAAGMLILGLIWLTCLIISPFSTLVNRY